MPSSLRWTVTGSSLVKVFLHATQVSIIFSSSLCHQPPTIYRLYLPVITGSGSSRRSRIHHTLTVKVRYASPPSHRQNKIWPSHLGHCSTPQPRWWKPPVPTWHSGQLWGRRLSCVSSPKGICPSILFMHEYVFSLSCSQRSQILTLGTPFPSPYQNVLVEIYTPMIATINWRRGSQMRLDLKTVFTSTSYSQGLTQGEHKEILTALLQHLEINAYFL